MSDKAHILWLTRRLANVEAALMDLLPAETREEFLAEMEEADIMLEISNGVSHDAV